MDVEKFIEIVVDSNDAVRAMEIYLNYKYTELAAMFLFAIALVGALGFLLYHISKD